MKHLIINYNNFNNDINKGKEIKKKILSLEDLDFIDKDIKTNDLILIKNYELIERKNFNFDDFYNKIILKHSDIDIFFLSSYHEKCKNLEKIDTLDSFDFFKSELPGEIEAMIFETNKWEKIKNNLIFSKEEKINIKIKNLILNGNLNALFTYPQVFYKPNNNFLEICRIEKEGFINPRIKELSFYWFLTTLIFTSIFMYLIYNKIPKDRFFYIK